jgi:hypothetical protein
VSTHSYSPDRANALAAGRGSCRICGERGEGSYNLLILSGNLLMLPTPKMTLLGFTHCTLKRFIVLNDRQKWKKGLAAAMLARRARINLDFEKEMMRIDGQRMS